jgi:hypothetical protein
MESDLKLVHEWMRYAEHYHWCPGDDGEECRCGFNAAWEAICRQTGNQPWPDEEDDNG